MDCPLIEPDLVAFHFGTPTEQPRAAVEQHLLGCPRCLAAYLALKRAAEVGDEAAPSPAARARLRAAVAKKVGAEGWSWWERPLAFGLAAASLAACFAAWHALVPPAPRPRPAAERAERPDPSPDPPGGASPALPAPARGARQSAGG